MSTTLLIKRKYSNEISDQPPAKRISRCCCCNCFYFVDLEEEQEVLEESVGSNVLDDDHDDDVQEIESQLMLDVAATATATATYDDDDDDDDELNVRESEDDRDIIVHEDRGIKIKPRLYSFHKSPMMEETSGENENEVEIIERADFYGGWLDFDGCRIIDNNGLLLGRFSQIDEELQIYE